VASAVSVTTRIIEGEPYRAARTPKVVGSW
jgi:hypothetical protein